MTTFDLLAGLPLRIEDCVLEGLEREVSSDFTRKSTVIRLRGAGHEGVGEDVTYDAEDHDALQAAGAPPGLAATGTSPRGTTGSGPSNPPRWTSRCDRRASPCTRRCSAVPRR